MSELVWGVFEGRKRIDHTIHVALCDANGMMAAGHTFESCECGPRMDRYGVITVVVHREES